MKAATENEYQKAMNRVIDFINENLPNNISLNDIAASAHISAYHFHRIFKAFIGESIGSFVMRLRIEKAAHLLQNSNLNLTQIAERTGYASHYALSKAFKKHFGIPPSAFKNINSYFSQNLSSAQPHLIELNPEIKDLEETKLLYIRIIAPYGSEIEYDNAWKKLWKYTKENGLLNRNNDFIGLSFDNPSITRQEKCRFYACVSIENEIKPEAEFGIYKLKAGTYAVFTHKGAYSGLNDLYHSIYRKWLPGSGFRLRNAMPFEKYVNDPGRFTENELITEIYIPIKK